MSKIRYKNLVLNTDIEYYHNPFGGLDDTEIPLVIQPKYEMDQIARVLEKERPVIIQFAGKKGRGKTTHLRALYQHITDGEIHFLDLIDREMRSLQTDLVFIDSIGKIPLSKRMQLWFKKDISYVITTHWNRKIEFWLSGRNSKTYYFRGLSKDDLEKVLKNRIALASNKMPEKVYLDSNSLNQLIKHFDDDIRGILNFLYDLFNYDTSWEQIT